MSRPSRNARRFFRIDMPVRYFITACAPLFDRDIYSTGAKYHTPYIHKQLADQKQKTLESLNHIQDQKEALTDIFIDIIRRLEFFGECCEMIARGHNPRLNKAMWQDLLSHQYGFTKIKPLEQSSPKTYQHLKTIEDKYLFFLNQLVESISNSTADHFYAPDYLPHGFRIDELSQIFGDTKYDNIPLVQSILHSAEFITTHTELFRRIHDDHCLRQNPTDWPEETANVSAGGLAVLTEKSFDIHQRVHVHLYFPEAEKVLKFDGVIVNIQGEPLGRLERMAMNFEFPDSKDQAFLHTEIQRYEIQECLNFKL